MAILNRRAAEVAVAFGARAAIDVTGFGLLGHASQLADAGRVSLRLVPKAAWVLPRVLELAAAGVAPAGLHKNRGFYRGQVGGRMPVEPLELALYDPQTSGGLLIAVPARKAAGLIGALRRGRVWLADLGEVTARGPKTIELA